jgi:hypothetical protein
MVSDSTAIRPPALTRDQAGTLLGQTMGLVAVTAGFFALGAYLGRNVAYQWGWLFFIGSVLLLIAINVAAQRSEQAAITLLFGFGVLIGLAVAPTVAYYTSADLRDRRTRHLRRTDGLRLPAPAPKQEHQDCAVARRLHLSRHPQRLPPTAVALWPGAVGKEQSATRSVTRSATRELPAAAPIRPRHRIGERRLKIGRYLFDRHGGKVVFFGRFFAIPRT